MGCCSVKSIAFDVEKPGISPAFLYQFSRIDILVPTGILFRARVI